MLEQITITDFAVARSVRIEPGGGLTVFTGETGAGKSLVVDALAFVFGARRGREVIATGAERAVVRANLVVDGQKRVVERSIALSGRTSARVDDELATVDDLRALAEGFVDIHGQSEQLAILRPAVQLAVLDEFAGLAADRDAVARLVRELRDVRRQMSALSTDARERERLIEQLRFEVDEIEGAALRPGEDAELRNEQSVLGNARRLLDDAAAALEALDASPTGEVARAVGDLAQRDASAGELQDLAATLDAAATDLARALRQYRERVEEDPERLEAVGERLDRIARLCRKYGERVEDVVAYGVQARRKLDELTGAGQSVDELRGKEEALLAELGAAATALSRARRGAAGDLVRAIAVELDELAMAGATLSVGFSCDDDLDGPLVPVPDYEIVITQSPLAGEGEPHPRAFTESGVDRIEFLVSFNAGEAPRPLSAVASGGETSRFLLALTIALGKGGTGRLEVLDEVDEGVGGRTGGVVGAALARLASRPQGLCITHLPQVAAFGDRHFVVTKQSDGERTWSEVREVSGDERVNELAAMLGG
ncbi:MAG TPA: DNA repair protein RecN, partial [Tepidiformaceae bacterium]|nr:DNA repair protein RecN [Tepidiformaceae bacterium]